MKRKLVYIISQVSHSKLFEWTAELLSKEKYELCFILMHKGESPFETYLRSTGFTVYRLPYHSKTDIPGCVRKIRSILKKEKAEIVHTHLFEAGLAGMLGARLAGIKRRIHTRHDAMIHHDFHPSAVKYDRLTNRLATDVIAITKSVYHILNKLEGVPQDKIHLVNHGFRLEEYADVSAERFGAMIKKYQLGDDHPVIGVVSRFIEWKGIQYIIPAFKRLLADYPHAHLLLCNAQGPYETELLQQLKEVPEKNYTRIIFETDMAALYKTMNVFVHVPVDEKQEAFGQVYIEAAAAGTPMVITRSGIAKDIFFDGVNSLCVPFRNSEEIYNGIHRLLTDDKLNLELRKNAAAVAFRHFGIETMITHLERIYDA